MALWGTQLLNTDAYYVNYLLILIAAAVCFRINAKSADLSISSDGDRFTNTVILVSAAAFSCMVGSANYRIWALTDLPEEFGTCFRWIYRIFLIVSIYVGGFFGLQLHTIMQQKRQDFELNLQNVRTLKELIEDRQTISFPEK